MRYLFPVSIHLDEDNRHVASCRDIPEALTDGLSREEALAEMSDALGAALAGYVQEGREMPQPSPQRKTEIMVPVAPLVAAKLALRTGMREKGLSNIALGKLLGISEGAVRRLLNPDHASKLEGVIQALSVTGRQLVIEDLETETL
jgi:antitoxin HicB